MKKGTIAIIGCGEAGYEMHLPALARMKDVTVVGAVDTDESRRQRAASKFSVPVFADYQEMLRRAQPETVIIATPPDHHTSICLDVISAGAHIICEKRFVPALAEGQQIIDAAAQAGVRIALNHEFREMPIFRAVVDATRNNPEEKVFFASLWQNTDVPPWTEKGWRGAMLRRTLHEAGIHLIDYILALFGETPRYAWASMSAGGHHESESDALVVVSLEFSGGRIAQLNQNRLCKGETQYFEVRADTPSSSYRASFGGRARVTTGLYRSTVPHLRIDYGVSGLAWIERGNKRKLLARNPPDPRVVSTQLILERSLDAFRSGGRPPATAEDAQEALRVIDACYASAKNGTKMQVGA
jgi:predicted dehydrogenase